MVALHSLAHTAFGIRGGKGCVLVSSYGMGFIPIISIKSETELSPFYAPSL